MKRTSIYHTNLYRNKYEQIARQNLLKELENITRDAENQKSTI